MKRLIVAFVFVFVGVASAAVAPELHIGVGASSCSAWTFGRKADAAALAMSAKEQRQDTDPARVLHVAMMTSWIQGFLTGMLTADSRFNGKKAAWALPEGIAVEGWTDKYCGDHPLDDIFTAGMHLFLEIYKK